MTVNQGKCPVPSRTGRVLYGLGAGLAAMALMTGCDIYFDETVPDREEVCSASDDNGPPLGGFPLELGQTTKSADVPPISGGTLALSPDDVIAVAADPDRDQIYVVSLELAELRATIPLQAGDEPGRVIFRDATRAYVALRSGGAIAAIDVAEGTLLGRFPACPAPRGIDYDETDEALYVACHGGELIRMNPDDGTILDEAKLEQGLRDVVAANDDMTVTPDNIYVSVFRSAELLVLSRSGEFGSIKDRMKPASLEVTSFDREGDEFTDRFVPGVAWRTVANPQGGVVMLHQRARKGQISITEGGYGGDSCIGGVVHGAITPFNYGLPVPETAPIASAVLPVDLALVNNSQESVVVAAGNGMGDAEFLPSVMQVETNAMFQDFGCSFGRQFFQNQRMQPIAVAARRNSEVIVQSREPSTLEIYTQGPDSTPISIVLSEVSKKDTGQQLFHINSGGDIACASCHPEGGDDGKVWDFACIGPRRTQSLHFGLLGTEPFHWDGDMEDVGKLMSEVFVGRMGGGTPRSEQIDAMAEWLDAQRPPPRSIPGDPDGVARGEALFLSAEVGCATCHSGPKLTDNRSHDVGTGGVFQTPSLVGIADRAPFIHTGCAPTLKARFTDKRCGGGDKHGVVSGLNEQQVADLVQFLETL